MLKVSVITVCFNSADTIESTIQSVCSQDHKNLEYIIVDGGSTDGTLAVIEKFRFRITKLISEKDDGLYDAINKGIAMATGDVIAILHADDMYANDHVLSAVAQLLETSSSDTAYGDLKYVDRMDVSITRRHWVSGKYQRSAFLKGWMPPHPAFFARKKCYDRFGKFNTGLKSAADYELMLRFLYKYECSAEYLPQVLVKMRVGGKSNQSLLNRLRANREDKKAWEINGITPGIFTFIRKPLSKIGQFFK